MRKGRRRGAELVIFFLKGSKSKIKKSLGAVLISINHSISSIVCLLSSMVDLDYSNVMTSLL